MQAPQSIIGLALAAAVALAPGLGSAEEKAKDEPTTQQRDDEQQATAPPDSELVIASNMPMFVPPNRGAPPMRLGGATRSAHKPAEALPRMQALVPEQPGWTLASQPVLYWYLDKTTDFTLEFGLQRVDPQQQIVRKRLSRPAQAGIQRIDVAEHGVKLEPGHIYFWFVKLVPNPDNPEQDKIVGGGIRRVSADDALTQELANPSTSRPHALAQAGMWYDAMDAYAEAIDAHPSDSALQQQRAALLEQVNIAIDSSSR